MSHVITVLQAVVWDDDDDDDGGGGGGVQGYGAKHITLYDIRAELSKRYKDLRTLHHSPTVEECFNLLTKETPETFYIGITTLLLSLSSACIIFVTVVSLRAGCTNTT